jgi:hypothetical protein
MGSFSSSITTDPSIQTNGKIGGSPNLDQALSSIMNPPKQMPQAYQGTLGLPDGTGVNGALTMSATSGQPQMGQPNTFSNTPQVNDNTSGGKGKGA